MKRVASDGVEESVSEVTERMREDWDRRAREDARYYAAFGRRGQDEEEFLSSAAPVLYSNLERELKWYPRSADRSAMRALEIGCGPGRLLVPMSRHFGEIHGVDVSEEMLRLARERLHDIPHARVHRTDGTNLAGSDDETFDFVYSYAVFQHIPSREIVMNYLREARRVLKTGGLMRCQLNGLPETVGRYDTWNGVRISGAEIREFARANDLQLLALEGVSTQYMWMTARKRPPGWIAERSGSAPGECVRIRRITNARSMAEPVLPCRGRFASVSLWVEDLPDECDLLGLEATIGHTRQLASYIGPPEMAELQQVNVFLSGAIETGLAPVRLWWLGKPLCPETNVRVIPPGPAVPRLLSASDGIDLLSGTRITSGIVKVVLEEVEGVDDFYATIDGQAVENVESCCVDPQPPRFEVNFEVPEAIGSGPHSLEMRLGRRRFAPIAIDIAG